MGYDNEPHITWNGLALPWYSHHSPPATSDNDSETLDTGPSGKGRYSEKRTGSRQQFDSSPPVPAKFKALDDSSLVRRSCGGLVVADIEVVSDSTTVSEQVRSGCFVEDRRKV